MTERKHITPLPSRLKSASALSFGRVSFGLICLFFLGLLMRNSRVAIGYVSEGLSLCAKTLIPSLFPFMVLSELIVSSGAIRPLGRLLTRPTRCLFGIGGEGAGAVLLGFLCGFPLGAKTAASLYRGERIGLVEFHRLMTFCNVPSLGFLVFAVGESLFFNRTLGIELYGITLLSALLIGLFSKHFFKGEETDRPIAHPDSSASVSPMTALTDAVASSTTAMLRICAYVLFFFALVGILEDIISPLALSSESSALIFGFFELTGGITRAAACSSLTAPYLCVAIAGWSGLSVHFQIICLCDGIRFPVRSYFFSKTIHALLNVLLLRGYTLLKALLM